MMMPMPLALVRRVIAILAMLVIMVIVRLLMPMIMAVLMPVRRNATPDPLHGANVKRRVVG